MAKITTIIGTTDKTCTLDPLPTKQLNDNMESVVPIITYVTNASLENAVVLKQAIVRPLLKKQSFDKDILNNYRPVSNLNQLSKVIDLRFNKITIPNNKFQMASGQGSH